MKNIRYIAAPAAFLALVLGLFIITRPDRVTEAEKQKAHDFVARYFGVDPASVPPAIVVQDSDTLEQVIRSTNQVLPDYMASAVYIPGTIYLRERFQLPHLVHENVHHFQLMLRQKFPCANARERDAYLAQNIFAAANGYRIYVDTNLIEKLSACKDAD